MGEFAVGNAPYRAGYSVLPQLRKISLDEVFVGSPEERQAQSARKREIPFGQIWDVADDCSAEIEQAVHAFLRARAPDPLAPSSSLAELARQLPEDVVIHRAQGGRDWMARGCVWFPMDWRPEEKIGRSFREIHQPVPGMNLDQSAALVRTMIERGPFERFVWNVLHEERWHFHPAGPPRATFDPRAPRLFLKVERQVIVGFPELQAAVFLLSQSLTPESGIDKPALRRALASMTVEQRAYKGLTGNYAPLMQWLLAGEEAGEAAGADIKAG